MANQMNEYMNDLFIRYWQYQKLRFKNFPQYFERSFADDGRPPVFIKGEAWRNIITAPNADANKNNRLFSLVPDQERHKWFRSMNSSQALALSVLGNLAIHDQLDLLVEIEDEEGHYPFHGGQTTSSNFQMEYKISHFHEPRRTSLDGFFSGDYQIATECKFTETEVGACSRPRLSPSDSNYLVEHCDGTFSKQRGRQNRCSLSEVKIQYWDFIPHLFNWDSSRDMAPCPLLKNYQLVRNVLAACVRTDGQVAPEKGHAVFVYDERNPAFRNGGAALSAFIETQNALRHPAALRKCSWQRIIKLLRERRVLAWLTEESLLKYGL
jgi:hypothetical protein